MLYLPPLSLLFFEAKKNTPKTKQRDFETALNHKKAFLQQENACPKKNNEDPPFLAWGDELARTRKKSKFRLSAVSCFPNKYASRKRNIVFFVFK